MKKLDTTKDNVALAVVVGTAVFGTYQLAKLGVDWTKEGVRSFKNRSKK